MTLKVKVMEWLHGNVQGQYRQYDLEFQGHAIEIEQLTITVGFLDLEKPKIQRGCNNPLDYKRWSKYIA